MIFIQYISFRASSSATPRKEWSFLQRRSQSLVREICDSLKYCAGLYEREIIRVLNNPLQATHATTSTQRWLRRTEIGSSMTSGELAENRNMILSFLQDSFGHITVQGWALPQLGLLRPFHPWYRYSGDHFAFFFSTLVLLFIIIK